MKAKRASEHTGTYLLEPGSREERAYLGLDRDVGSLINDALKIIRPPAAQEVQCHRSIVYSIRGVIDAARVVSSKKQRDKLVVVAQSLPKIHREIEKNRAYLLLPVSPISFPADQVQKWRQEYEIQQKDLGRRRLLLESFLKELDQSAEGVDQLSKDAKPRRSGGGKKDYQKREAVLNAFILLRGFSEKRPSLTINGAFPKLADTLYQAATGKVADLYSQCRALHKSKRGSGAKHS